MSVVAFAIKKGQTWTCKICKQDFGDVLSTVTHLLTSCDNQKKTFDTSSLVNICVHLDPRGSQGFLESYTRVYRVGQTLCLRPHALIDVLTSSQVDPRMQTAVGEGTTDAEDSAMTDDDLLSETGQSEETPAVEPSNGDSNGKGPALLDALDHDLLGDSDDSEAGEVAPTGGSKFPATPPAWLSEKDKTEWRMRQDR